MALKKRLTTIIAGLALLVTVIGASANVVDSTSSNAAAGQAIACYTTGSSGGGC